MIAIGQLTLEMYFETVNGQMTMVHCHTNTSPEPSAYGELNIIDWDVNHQLKQTQVKGPEGIVYYCLHDGLLFMLFGLISRKFNSAQ